MALVFERVLTEGLGDLSYLIGDDAKGAAAVIDPRADCEHAVFGDDQVGLDEIRASAARVITVASKGEVPALIEQRHLFRTKPPLTHDRFCWPDEGQRCTPARGPGVERLFLASVAACLASLANLAAS